MTDFIIGNTWIATLKERRVLPVFGDIVLKNGMISEIRKHDFQDFLRTDISRLEDKNIVDVGGRITTVPFINFHDHFYSRLARGLIASGEMENFRQILQNLWWKLDRLLDNKLIQAAVDQGCMESLRSGVTYVFDHHASPGSITGVLPLMAKRLQDRGLRSVLCMEVSDRVGEEKAHQQLEENAEFIKTQEGPDVRGMLGLHAPFTLSDMTLEIASGLRGSLGCAIHIHLAEDAYEQEFSHERFGRSPVERLEKYHLLTPESLLVHGVHLTREDYTLIAERGSAIVLNPDSNMNNSVGLPQYGGIPQNIMLLPGTDGMHGGIGRTFKQLYLLARHQGFSFERATGWIEKIYFDSIERVKRTFSDFPGLQPGERGDIVIWDYIPATPLEEKNFWGHWIYGLLESRVHSVIQDGQFLMREYKPVGIDETSLHKEIIRQGHRLFRLFEEGREI